MVELPGGTVTFLFSDIEGSTRLLQALGERWEGALARHNEILRDAFARAGGREIDRQGDAFFAVFSRARDAVAAAAAAQRALAAEAWPEAAEVRVRMGIHTGEPSVGGEGYLGLDVVRAARICSAAQGGQVLISETTRALVRGGLDGLELQDLGEHRLKDIEHPERLFQLAGPGLATDFPPLRALDRPASAPPLPMAGREAELAARAASAARQLEGLGPRIEQWLQEALAARGIPSPRPVGTAEVKPTRVEVKPTRVEVKPTRVEVKRTRALVLAAFVVVASLAAVVAIVYLVLQAF
jgi:class 3 adenylate cyclase